MKHRLCLCQEYGVTDAAAFLLERVGDVGSALLLTLSSLNDKFIKLDNAVQSITVSNKVLHAYAGTEYFNTIIKLEEVCANMHKLGFILFFFVVHFSIVI